MRRGLYGNPSPTQVASMNFQRIRRILSHFIAKDVQYLVMTAGKLKCRIERVDACLQQRIPTSAFVPREVPYHGPWVTTTSMRERWAKLDRQFALDRTALSLEFSKEGLIEVSQGSEDKIQVIADLCLVGSQFLKEVGIGFYIHHILKIHQPERTYQFGK